MRILVYASLLFLSNIAIAQDAVVFGVINSAQDNRPIEFAIVNLKNTSKTAETDSLGNFRIEVPSNEAIEISFSRIGFSETSIAIKAMAPGSKRYVNVKLAPKDAEMEVIVTASRVIDGGMVREEVTEFKLLPNASGNFESLLPNIALGVSSGSGGELSSQYNVRGGNYDENLIYVNDFEIFKPQLIRSGQQEGLSFPNIDLIRDLSFSSGGYQSRYGDKMSSVLDIRYKRPEEFRASVNGSLLGASAHIEGSKKIGSNAYNKFRYLLGARYKTNKYLLGSLDVQGEYVPNFVDLQAYLTYDITKSLQLGVIGNYNDSRYNFIPQSRSTAVGGFTFAVKLTSVFDGQEKDGFTNGMGGLSLTYVPEKRKNPLFLKFMASRYASNEQERIDILGYYRLSQIETNFGSDNFGEELAILGVGTQHNYSRNFLFYTISNAEHRGGIEFVNKKSDGQTSNFVQWGLKAQAEYYDDQINEWERIDSADYSIPYNGEAIVLSNVLKTKNEVRNTKVNGYLQNTFSKISNGNYELSVITGLRASYLELNKEFLLSPRVSLAYQPRNLGKEVSFTLASGVYYQSPFYRELRQLDGVVNSDVKSQKSIHVVGGINYDFNWSKVGKKPFKLISEIYYKRFSNLVSYDIDNVRIRYSGNNDANGYAAGLDFRVNGEFVPGAESWLNVGFLKTAESITGVQHLRKYTGDTIATEVTYVPRPTDRLMTLNLFFQDYLPKNENIKVNVNLSFGTGLPFGVKDDNIIYRNTYRFKNYHRVDLGFIYQIWDKKKASKSPDHWLTFCKSAAISLEVFNLLKVQNPASNTWIKTITNDQYAISNNLTSRRINLRLRMDF